MMLRQPDWPKAYISGFVRWSRETFGNWSDNIFLGRMENAEIRKSETETNTGIEREQQPG